ncbi:hypothetical protein [Desulfobacter curvatus]|uniref:hypothetical protein n=1 Tax=Desulfobacter curvatus TaxID=2290 RepID=UPI00036EEE7B|nr:hypothetical protein [Desulfobacter curvatus]
MKLQYQLNVFAIVILLSVSGAICSAGVFAINRVTMELNTKLINNQVSNVMASADASKFIINDIRGAERHLKLFCRKIIIDTLQVF